MNKNTVFFLCILCMFSICRHAEARNSDPYNLAGQYGDQLMRSDFTQRHEFARQTGKDWAQSTYEERKSFLTQKHQRIAERKRIFLQYYFAPDHLCQREASGVLQTADADGL